MSENVTNELILEHLKAIQAKLAKTDQRLESVEAHVRSTSRLFCPCEKINEQC